MVSHAAFDLLQIARFVICGLRAHNCGIRLCQLSAEGGPTPRPTTYKSMMSLGGAVPQSVRDHLLPALLTGRES
jgi:hypothetical protein